MSPTRPGPGPGLPARMRAEHGGGGGFTVAVNQRAGSYLAATAHRLGWRPTVLTLGNLTIGVGTGLLVIAVAPLMREGRVPAVLVGVIALVGWQLAYSLDCADGQLARHAGVASPAGGRLDVLCDLAVQISVLTALVSVAGRYRHLPLALATAFAGTWLANLVTSLLSRGKLAASLIASRSAVVVAIKLVRDYGAVIAVAGVCLALAPAALYLLLIGLTLVNGCFLAASIAAAAIASLRGSADPG